MKDLKYARIKWFSIILLWLLIFLELIFIVKNGANLWLIFIPLMFLIPLTLSFLVDYIPMYIIILFTILQATFFITSSSLYGINWTAPLGIVYIFIIIVTAFYLAMAYWSKCGTPKKREREESFSVSNFV